MRSDERFEITAIARDGQLIEPIRTKEAFAAQCGVLLRDKIPISIHQWHKPKEEDKSCALKKMADLFRRWRKELKKFVDK